MLRPTDEAIYQRIQRIDQFSRKWAQEHGEDYQGYEFHHDFVIYTTIKADGDWEIRCDDRHLGNKEILSAVRRIDPFPFKQADFPGHIISLEKSHLLEDCRNARMQQLARGEGE